MKNGKKMYVVRGSEDGIIGVFSNIKRAYEKASHYAKTCAGSTTANRVTQMSRRILRMGMA